VSAPAAGRRRRPGRGQALAEFALVLPILLLVLGGIADFGFALYSRLTLIGSAREGARWAVIQSDVTQITPTNVKAQIIANFPQMNASDLTVTVGCVPNPATLGSHPTCVFANGANKALRLDSADVRATYVYRSFFAQLFGNTIPLSTEVQMVLEVPE
jgi:Flp pilus assembly protein TadG